MSRSRPPRRPRRFPNAARATRHLADVDPKLAEVIERVGPVRVELDPEETIFESLASSIIYQQPHGKAAATILKRFVALFGAERADFPEAAEVLAMAPERLRSAGLSTNKAKAITALARMVIEGVVPVRERAERMDDEALIEAFSAVPGIGRWTAQMLLIFTLGRPDVLPTGDYGVRNGFHLLYRKRALPTPAALERAAEPWRPFRSVASWYLWRVTELEQYRRPAPKRRAKTKVRSPRAAGPRSPR